jgi:hypothetical protein
MEMSDGWLYGMGTVDMREEVAKELEEACINLQMDMAMYANDEHPDPDWEPPSGGYGCMACEECYARETLSLVVPIIVAAVLAGTIRPTRINEIAPDVDTSVVVPLAPVAGSSRQKAGTPKKENDDPRTGAGARYDAAHPAVHTICTSCGEPNGVHRIGCPRPR